MMHALELCVLLVLAGSVYNASASKVESSDKARRKRPNVILFVGDDMGYGDLSVYGHPTQEWGAIDELAAGGMRFTQFYSVAVFCTPSRASLLTGRFSMRSGMDGETSVQFPCHNQGLPHSEITFPEALQKAGYTTGMVGKWHLGINAYSHNDGSYLPHTHGFDYVGHILPHTLVWDCDTYKRHRERPKLTKCFLFRNTTIIQQPTKLENLTSRFLHDAKAFLHENHAEPFFLYYSFPQAHTPMFHMEGFKGSSKRGIYGDQINEMAWAVAEVMALVKDLGIEEETLSLFVSDHGPHVDMCEESGSPGNFYGGKANFFEGAVRIPAIAHWPGTIPKGVTSTSLTTLMDLYSTFIQLSGAEEPTDRHLDGRSFAHLLQPDLASKITDQQTASARAQHTGNSKSLYYNQDIHDIVFFFCMDRTLIAVRYKQFKIYLRESPRDMRESFELNCNGSMPIVDRYHNWCFDSVPLERPIIYNVEEDPSEYFVLHAENYEDVLKEVNLLVEQKLSTMTDLPPPQLTMSNCARKLIPCCNPPYCVC